MPPSIAATTEFSSLCPDTTDCLWRDRPITTAGEEIDCLALYDHVENSRDYVFSYRNRNIANIYTTLGRFAFWQIASLVTAGRLYAIEQYPKIMQVLRDLSGQGLISRVPESTWVRSDVSATLDEFLPGHDVNARDKNNLFNLVWDLTCSGHGLRIALFEALNATPAPALREDLYRIHDNPEARTVMRELAGLDQPLRMSGLPGEFCLLPPSRALFGR